MLVDGLAPTIAGTSEKTNNGRVGVSCKKNVLGGCQTWTSCSGKSAECKQAPDRTRAQYEPKHDHTMAAE